MCVYSAAYSAEQDSVLVSFVLVENGDTLTENGIVLTESYYVYFDKPNTDHTQPKTTNTFNGTAIINGKRMILNF